MLDQLIALFRDPSGDRPAIFAPDFTYVTRSGDTGLDYWTRGGQQRLGWPDLEIIGMIMSGETAAVFMKGAEQVTLLPTHLAWWIECRDGLVVRIFQISEVAVLPMFNAAFASREQDR